MDTPEFVAFDLETTGLDSTFDRIVEFGAVRFRADGTELDRMEQLVDPACAVPADATRRHGITDAMLRGQPSLEEALPKFVQFLGGPETILLAHKASFDIGFLSAAFSRCQTAVPLHPVVDTLAMSRRRLRRLPKHSLEAVSRHFSIAAYTEHRALADCLVLMSVFLRLLRLRPAIRTVSDLFRLVPPLYFEPVFPDPVTIPPGYEPLAEAIEISRCISIVYDGGTKGRRRRQITPRSLTEARGSIYLVAHCHIDEVEKHFRLDRILEIEEG